MVSVAVADDKLYCRDRSDGSGWAIRAEDIVLVAEYTTTDGPNDDDYFLVFVTRENEEVFYSIVTMAAAGMSEALQALEQHLHAPLELTLESCRQRASCVLWPKDLAGTAYFEYVEVEPAGVWEKVRAQFRGKRIKERVADRVVRHLNLPDNRG